MQRDHIDNYINTDVIYTGLLAWILVSHEGIGRYAGLKSRKMMSLSSLVSIQFDFSDPKKK